MQESEIQHLLKKYKAGTCSDNEKALLEAWYLQYEDADLVELSDSDRASDLEQIRELLITWPDRKKERRIYAKMTAVAAVVLLVSVSLWLSVEPRKAGTVKMPVLVKHDVQPGSNKAILTLADGSVINLNDVTTGEIANQSGIIVIKAGDGLLEYSNNLNDSLSRSGEAVKFNTIHTPRGGQYQIKLPDGTQVWLNAESSLKYPTYFAGDERRVELTGEAYFEVVRNVNMPFKVYGNSQLVEVLGTRFNINSYKDEQVSKTTLIEGSVRIVNLAANKSDILKPGQQALISQQKMKIHSIDPGESIAWKNGFITFENEKITSVMKKISRWYDVTIVYEGKVTDSEFNGSVSRFENVSKVLEILELTKSVHFKIDGRRITVMP